MLLPNTKFITPVLFDTGILILYFKPLSPVSFVKKFVIFSEKILVEVKKIIITDIALN